MYLTQGQFKGFKIETPKEARPTLSKVRESVFNMLSNIDVGKKFLDMFAGSGIMGLEALSYGFSVVQLEKNPKCAQLIKKNYQKFPIKPKLFVCDALKYKTKGYDVIYIDPPWEYDYSKIICHALKLLNSGGVIVIEHENELNCIPKELINIKSKKYGRCLIDIYQPTTLSDDFSVSEVFETLDS